MPLLFVFPPTGYTVVVLLGIIGFYRLALFFLLLHLGVRVKVASVVTETAQRIYSCDIFMKTVFITVTTELRGRTNPGGTFTPRGRSRKGRPPWEL